MRIIATLVVGVTVLLAQSRFPARVTSGSDPLLQSTDLTYEGAFNPAVATTLDGGACVGDLCSMNYSTGVMGFDAAGNGGLGSLWVGALNSGLAPSVYEISVSNDLASGTMDPADTTIAQMPTAKLLSQAADVFDGQDTVGGTDWLGGLLPVTYGGQPRLLGVTFSSFGVASNFQTHFILTKSTSAPAVIVGPREVNGTGVSSGSCAGGANCPDGWVGQSSLEVPSAYQASIGGDMLSGMQDASIIGRTSHGPTATRWTLADMSANPVVGKKLLGYWGANETLGKWTTGSDGATSPGGTVGGTGQISSQNDWNRMVWPTGYRTLLYAVVMGNTTANCYGPFVAGDADGDPVEDAIGLSFLSGADGSTSNGGATITVPNKDVSSIGLNAGHGYIWLSEQATPVNVYAGRNYRAMSEIVSVANSGTASASVTVRAGEEFTDGLTSQDYSIGDPACYDPMTHRDTTPDVQPSSGHGPSAYPYQAKFYAYDVNDLIAVNAGTMSPWEPVPYATWNITIPTTYPGGKYANVMLGTMALDTVSNKIYLSALRAGANDATIIMQYGFTPGSPAPSMLLPVSAMAAMWALGGLWRRRG